MEQEAEVSYFVVKIFIQYILHIGVDTCQIASLESFRYNSDQKCGLNTVMSCTENKQEPA